MGETRAKIGRPTLKSPALLQEFCRRIASGRSVTSICHDDDMPSDFSVWKWLSEDEEFSRDYTRAIQARAMAHAERIDDLAEQAVRGEIPADVARVAIDAKKWTASRLLPKIYGDKQQVEATVTHTHTLHLEALKELADRGRGTSPGYIEGQATEIPSEVAVPGGSRPRREPVKRVKATPVEPVPPEPPEPPEPSGPVAGVEGAQTPPAPATGGGRVRARQARSLRTSRAEDPPPPTPWARPRGAGGKYKKEK